MRRRRFLAAIGVGGIILPASVGRAAGVPVVGILVQSPAFRSRSVEQLRNSLREIGYVEGRTISVDVKSAGGRAEPFPLLAAQLVTRKVDVVVAIGPAALKAARAATTGIPIVALDLETDPVEAGYAKSIAHPGGNVTGVFLDLPELTGKWLELIKEAAPAVRRVALLRDVATGPWQLTAARAAAQKLGLDLLLLEVQRPEDLEPALQSSVKGDSRALVELSSPLLNQRPLEAQVAAFSIKHRIPTISMFQSFAHNGGLLAYGPDEPSYLRRLAASVDRVLKGISPADIPIEQPATFALAVNLRTARAIGLTISPALLQRANAVIE
jgi:ABC-type uncharacterized transport system substrate-binding protein